LLSSQRIPSPIGCDSFLHTSRLIWIYRKYEHMTSTYVKGLRIPQNKISTTSSLRHFDKDGRVIKHRGNTSSSNKQSHIKKIEYITEAKHSLIYKNRSVRLRDSEAFHPLIKFCHPRSDPPRQPFHRNKKVAFLHAPFSLVSLLHRVCHGDCSLFSHLRLRPSSNGCSYPCPKSSVWRKAEPELGSQPTCVGRRA
jgi:hypothetical protein